MAGGLDDHESAPQFAFAIQPKDAFQLGVDRMQIVWQDTQIQDAGSQGLNENQSAVVPIASHEHPPFDLRERQELRVCGPRLSEFGGGDHIVTAIAQERKG